MTEKEIIRFLQKGETHKVEYKPSLSDMDRFTEVVCSFANTEGGVILIGIKEGKGNVKERVAGIDIGKDIIARLANRIIDKTDPANRAI